MKMLVPVLILVAAAVIACAGPLKEIRVGQTYALVDPYDVMISAGPSSDAETVFLEDPETFVIEGAVCAEEKGLSGCFSDMMIAGKFKGAAGSAFYLVRFESGRKGYISAGYFYPKLSYAIASKERAGRSGLDLGGLASKLRAERKALKAEFERFEQERRRLIEESAWSLEVKRLLIERRLFKGMDRDQAMLSLARAGRHPKITQTETEKGESEKWVLGEGVYYFRRGALIRWKTPAGVSGEKDDK